MSSITAATLRTLTDAVILEFAPKGTEEDRIREEISYVLSSVSTALQNDPDLPQSSRHAVTKHLAHMLHDIEVKAPQLARALRPVAEELPWRYGYEPRAECPGLENEMAWIELVGPAAPWKSDIVCLGLTLIGPDSFYPEHLHPAVELYTIISGISDWTLDAKTSRRNPGDRILHESNAIHAMRAYSSPLLAIYSWTGDTITPSRYT